MEKSQFNELVESLETKLRIISDAGNTHKISSCLTVCDYIKSDLSTNQDFNNETYLHLLSEYKTLFKQKYKHLVGGEE